MAQAVPATVGVAIARVGAESVCLGQWSAGVAWSTIKVPVAIAAVRAGRANADLLSATISRSDNAAAEQLWFGLGDTAAQRVQDVIRESGDTATMVECRRLRAGYTPFGQTRWSLADQARFAAALPHLPNASSVIELMHNLSADHRWGLAAKGYAAKGGWGPGVAGDYLVRQFAIVPARSGNVGVALAAEVRDGGYESGVDVVNTVTDWLVAAGLAEY